MTAAVVRIGPLPKSLGGGFVEEVAEVVQVAERGPVLNGRHSHKIKRESGEVRWVPGDWIVEIA